MPIDGPNVNTNERIQDILDVPLREGFFEREHSVFCLREYMRDCFFFALIVFPMLRIHYHRPP